MWKTRRPPALVVSIVSVSDRKPTSCSARSCTVRTCEPVELPDDERVAGADVVESGVEFRTMAAGAGRGFGEDLLAAGAAERADLQLGGVVSHSVV